MLLVVANKIGIILFLRRFDIIFSACIFYCRTQLANHILPKIIMYRAGANRYLNYTIPTFLIFFFGYVG